MSHDRKAASLEPLTLGNKWEDLLDAAASATEEDSRDLTPVSIRISVEEYHTKNEEIDTSVTPFFGSSFP